MDFQKFYGCLHFYVDSSLSCSEEFLLMFVDSNISYYEEFLLMLLLEEEGFIILL